MSFGEPLFEELLENGITKTNYGTGKTHIKNYHQPR
jgi:hypothetical protein